MKTARQHHACSLRNFCDALVRAIGAVGAAGHQNSASRGIRSAAAPRSLGAVVNRARRIVASVGELAARGRQTSRTEVVPDRRSARQRQRNGGEAPPPSQESERRGRSEQSGGRGLRLSAFQNVWRLSGVVDRNAPMGGPTAATLQTSRRRIANKTATCFLNLLFHVPIRRDPPLHFSQLPFPSRTGRIPPLPQRPHARSGALR